MSDLTLIHNKIFQSLLSTQMKDLGIIKEYNDIDPEERLLIHRRTILENLVNSLKISYPGIWKLLGEECARGVALAYSHDILNIPSRGKISEFGKNFPEFLMDFPSTSDLAYLSDFAKLEWLKNLSADSEAKKSMSPDEFKFIDLANLGDCRLIFNSSVFFMQSEFPLVKIQDLIDHDRSDLELTPEASYAVVYRDENLVYTDWIDKAQWYFLSSIAQSKTLAEAFDICEASELEVNLEETFQFILLKKLIVSFSQT